MAAAVSKSAPPLLSSCLFYKAFLFCSQGNKTSELLKCLLPRAWLSLLPKTA